MTHESDLACHRYFSDRGLVGAVAGRQDHLRGDPPASGAGCRPDHRGTGAVRKLARLISLLSSRTRLAIIWLKRVIARSAPVGMMRGEGVISMTRCCASIIVRSSAKALWAMPIRVSRRAASPCLTWGPHEKK